MHNLVIVESPAKAKTIKKYLGANYEVTASMGHIRDLPKTKLGIDIENDYNPQYVNIDGKKDLIKKLQTMAADSDKVYLASDPDREGEAIAWHLAQVLALDTKSANRVTFNEITSSGVSEGMKNPRKIDVALVDAQQARRVLDRLVGYKISPFLWKKIKRGLSAGRVQSVAVKIIVDREREIAAFVPVEYWTIDAKLSQKSKTSTFAAKFFGDANGKIEIDNEAQAKEIFEKLDGCEYVVSSIKKGVRNRKPAPPFTTSTMQQEASRKLNFTSKRTMRCAQALYEGVEIHGQGMTGLITYMRTDSLRISEEARRAGERYISEHFGEKYLPLKKTVYKAKNGAQDAHEAIRPANPSITPDSIKGDLTAEQYKLYKLIWERFISSLMAACVQNTMAVDITAGDYIFKSTGYSVKFDGFTALYEETDDGESEENNALPTLSVGEVLKLRSLTQNQHFTTPPARYTEASLIKTLEEKKIGRPSTYVPIISTILQREYVETEKKILKPTKLGEIVTEVMEQNFGSIVDEQFTAKMEGELDDIENGKRDWIKVIDNFYNGFSKTMNKAEENMNGKKINVPAEESDQICELCGRKMVIKSGRFGKFLACPGYPECKNTKPLVTEMPGSCPKCGGKILQRKSPKGHKYFACEKGKQCGFMSWDEPTSNTCPQCGKTLFKKRGGMVHCLTDGCGYEAKASRKSKTKNEENK